MSTSRIDPLALLAAEAEARSVDEKCNLIRENNGLNVIDDGPTMARQSAALDNSYGAPIHSYQTNANLINYPNRVETQHHRATLTGRYDITGNRQPTPSPKTTPGSQLRPSTGTSQSRVPASKRKPSFALKMHAVLSDPNCKSAITWLPAGKAFVILNRDLFVRQCLPKYFREAKFESFSRRLKRWGFQKIFTTGTSQAVYSHELFRKGRLDMCKFMNGNGTACTKYDTNKIEQSNNLTTEEEVAELKKLAKQAEATGAREADHKHVVPALMQPQFFPRSRHYMTAHSHPIEHVVIQPHMPPPARYIPGYDYQRQQASSSALGYPIPLQTQRYETKHTNCLGRDEYRSRLDEDISKCEEQLLVLHRMRALKERYYGLQM